MDDVLRSLLFIGATPQELPQELAKGGYATFTYESAVEPDKTVMWYMYVKIKKIETSCRDEGANEGWYTLEHGPLRRSLNGEVPSCGDVTPTTVQPFKMGVADKKTELRIQTAFQPFLLHHAAEHNELSKLVYEHVLKHLLDKIGGSKNKTQAPLTTALLAKSNLLQTKIDPHFGPFMKKVQTLPLAA